MMNSCIYNGRNNDQNDDNSNDDSSSVFRGRVLVGFHDNLRIKSGNGISIPLLKQHKHPLKNLPKEGFLMVSLFACAWIVRFPSNIACAIELILA